MALGCRLAGVVARVASLLVHLFFQMTGGTADEASTGRRPRRSLGLGLSAPQQLEGGASGGAVRDPRGRATRAA